MYILDTLSINYVPTYYINVRIIHKNVNLSFMFNQNDLLKTCIEINNCIIFQ